MTAEEIDNLIRKEVPIGSNKAEVLTFLDSRKIEHSDYLEDRKVIHGIIRNTSRGFLVRGSIALEFIFDEAGNLIDYKVKEVFTGP